MNENTKAFVGKLEPGIFAKIAELPNIEHLYTNFPEGKIRRSELEIDSTTEQELRAKLNEVDETGKRKVNVYEYAKDMLDKMFLDKEYIERNERRQNNPEKMNLVTLKVGDLGFTRTPTTDEVYARAEELGLELCPAETGPHQRLKDLEQPLDDWYRIAMKQITDRHGDPNVFYLGHNDYGLWLYSNIAKPDRKWKLGRSFVFRLRNVSQGSEAPKPLPQFEI
jgi:hypothetical protein